MDLYIYDMLYRNLSPANQLLTAVETDIAERLEELISSGTDIDQVVQTQGGNRAVHIACQKGNIKCLQRLLDAGACSDPLNDFGLTPLAYALRFGKEECATLLLASGGGRNTTDVIWPSPDWSRFSAETVTLLLQATPSMKPYGQSVLDRIYTSYIQHKHPEELIKMFYLTGNVLTAEQLVSLLNSVSADVANWLKGFHSRCDLQQRARVAIRRHLKPNVLYAATRLPLPVRLQQYLLVNDSDN